MLHEPPRVRDLDLVAVGRWQARRHNEELDELKPNPLGVLGSCTLTRNVPSLGMVHKTVRQRSIMSWQEFVDNTVYLGHRNPILLYFVRDLEQEAEQAYKQHMKKEEELLRRKRNRVKGFLERGGSFNRSFKNR